MNVTIREPLTPEQKVAVDAAATILYKAFKGTRANRLQLTITGPRAIIDFRIDQEMGYVDEQEDGRVVVKPFGEK